MVARHKKVRNGLTPRQKQILRAVSVAAPISAGFMLASSTSASAADISQSLNNGNQQVMADALTNINNKLWEIGRNSDGTVGGYFTEMATGIGRGMGMIPPNSSPAPTFSQTNEVGVAYRLPTGPPPGSVESSAEENNTAVTFADQNNTQIGYPNGQSGVGGAW